MKKILCLMLLYFVVVMSACSNIDIKRASENINNYKLDITYFDDNKTLSCIEDVSYVNKSDTTLSYIYFNLYANAFREDAKNKPVALSNYTKAYPNGASYGNIQILSVKNENKDIQYEIGGEDENVLICNLGKELFPNERVNLKIEFTVALANINHRLGYGENTINFGNFYPIACVYEDGKFKTNVYSSNGDPFYSQVANYNVKITYPSEYILACSGEQKTTSSENSKVSIIKANCIRDFAFVLSTKFKVLTAKINNVKIKYYYYNDETPEKSLETSSKTVLTNEKLFGKYPYSCVSVVEANFVHGGMEYPQMVLISDALPAYQVYENVIIHELGHQWWYGVVGNNQFVYGWIDEGLTEYATALFYNYNKGYETSFSNVISNALNSYCVFCKIYKDVYGNVDTSMHRSLQEYSSEPEYVYVVYLKSMLMFDSLKNILGEKVFFRTLKRIYSNYAFKEISPEQLISCFETVSGISLENFFNSWLNGEIIIINN